MATIDEIINSGKQTESVNDPLGLNSNSSYKSSSGSTSSTGTDYSISGLGKSLMDWAKGSVGSNVKPGIGMGSLTPDSLIDGYKYSELQGLKTNDMTAGQNAAWTKAQAQIANENGGLFGLNKSTIDSGIGLANLGKDIYGMFNAAKLTKATLNNLNTQTNIMNNNEARTAEEYGRVKTQRANNNAAYGGK